MRTCDPASALEALHSAEFASTASSEFLPAASPRTMWSAGGHDDLVALLFAEAVFGRECPPLSSGRLLRLFAGGGGLDPLLLDKLVGGEVGEVIKRSDVGLAQVFT